MEESPGGYVMKVKKEREGSDDPITENPRVRKSGAVWDRTGLMERLIKCQTGNAD